MSELAPIKDSWLFADSLQHLFDVLEEGGEEARVNGGAVRNSLLGESIDDLDLSTTILPKQVLLRLRKAGIKAIATGIEHGTVTAVIDKTPYEITTLRKDVLSDGRRAVVSFTRDWAQDAMRRDLTMNALYCDRHGVVLDPLGGYEDLMARNVRFIGDAETRIREDNLRILRFFRFFARYGRGRPDSTGLKACARLKAGIAKLSAERVWVEFKKILSAEDPSRAILWMRTTGVLNFVLPESEKWGIDFFNDLVSAEGDLNWPIDALARLQVMVPPTIERMSELSKRLRLSKAETKRLLEWAQSDLPTSSLSDEQLAKTLYGGSIQGISDRLRNEVVRQRYLAHEEDGALVDAAKFAGMLAFAREWQKPLFALSGKDLRKAGVKAGPDMGRLLKRLEGEWVESGFSLSKADLIARLES